MVVCNLTRIVVGRLRLGASVVLVLGLPVYAQFTSENVTLDAWLTLGDMGVGSGNDSWGYVSPSGGEYALMGTNRATVVVDLTDPSAPVVLASIGHNRSSWSDIKVFGQYAYVVTEGNQTSPARGMGIIDLSQVDAGVVTLVRAFTGSGLTKSHNVAINPDSGFLYVCGSNLNGGAIVVFDLNGDPTNPTEAGRWSQVTKAYHHDAHIITYNQGPYAGREIEFGFSEGRGLDIVDVTNKNNIFLISRTSYPNVAYCHQGWTSPDRKYLFVNDELDEGSPAVPTTRTLIFNITDLNDPFLETTYTTGLPARDHNCYVKGCVLFEANYTSGLRILSITDPLNPVEVGFFDTYPEGDGPGFGGAWSVFPFFPSGTVMVSDVDRGLFVLDVSEALALVETPEVELQFGYPQGLPQVISPVELTEVEVLIAGLCGADVMPGSATIHFDQGDGFEQAPLLELVPGQFGTILPPVPCGSDLAYYFSAQTTEGQTVTSPLDAPDDLFRASSALAWSVVAQDDFEAAGDWTTQNLGATSGLWQRGLPVDDDSWPFDPPTDGDGSGQCFLTMNTPGNSDVDNGSVRLISPLVDMSSGPQRVEYRYYLNLDTPDGADFMDLEVSNAAGAPPWTQIAHHDTDGGLNWRLYSIDPADFDTAGVTLTDSMVFRFTVTDGTPQSVVEAGLDGFSVMRADCQNATQPTIVSVASRVLHGSAGHFDALLTDGLLIEGRLDGVTELVVTLDRVLDPATVSPANVNLAGLFGGPYTGVLATGLNFTSSRLTLTLDQPLPDTDRYTVDLTGMASAGGGAGLANPTFQVLALRGDLDGSGRVTTGDASQIRFWFGQTADQSNFRFDFDADGQITTGDFSQVRPFFNNSDPL